LARRGHAALRSGLSLDAYLAADHALVSPRGLPGSLVGEELTRRGVERRVVLEVPSFLAGALVVAGSDLLLTIPERLADCAARTFDLEKASLPFDTPPVEFLQLWHARHQDDAAHVWLRAQIAAAAGG
jgi:DNA-binding transcriptional LysR family regulator